MIKKQRRQAMQESIVNLEQYTLEPNKMQVAFVKNVMKMREEGIDKALLLSSTGTGKSFASAFAVREMQPRRVLFLVHRDGIAYKQIKEIA